MASTVPLYRQGLRNLYRAVGAAIAYEWRKRSSRNMLGLGVFTTFAEPILMIAALVIMRVWLRDRLPRFGHSAAVFYASGILPYYLFQRLSSRGRANKYEAMQRLPRVTSTDQLVAQISLDTSMFLAAALLAFTGLWLYGLEEAKPWSIGDCGIVLLLLTMLGVGVGLTNNAITYFVPVWTWFWSRISRMLIFASGVFYISDNMDDRLRKLIVWNPLISAIDWFRIGLYGSYPHYLMDKSYLIWWSFGALLIGVVAHMGSLRRTPRKR